MKLEGPKNALRNLLGKLGKMRLGHEAVMLEDLKGSLKITREKYRQHDPSRIKKNSKSDPDPLDEDAGMIIADNITIDSQGWAKSAAIAALVGSAGVGGWLAARVSPTADRPAETITLPHSDTDTHWQLRIKDPD